MKKGNRSHPAMSLPYAFFITNQQLVQRIYPDFRLLKDIWNNVD